ncbi:MAG: SGNH/GDSL hydrolase family protein [Saprospiraceae bacterium]|jgi:lysophospholipase L1-like esterase|nr:SGNH/GDSL hydrolase family protein [Saprospiraceae bacterium]
MTRQLALKTTSIVLGTAFSLVLAEVVYRLYDYINFVDFKQVEAQARTPIDRPNDELDLGMIIQISAHRHIVYELIPSSKYKFQKVRVRTNSNGFRDAEYAATKPPKTRRIIGLGDSVMFGWGVNESECYLSQLEHKLNSHDSVKYEIINTGVPGYNTVMEVASLAHKFALNDIDMVVINYIGNDWHLPNFIRKKPNYFALNKSLIVERFKSNDGIGTKLETAPLNSFKSHYANTIDRTPPEYHDMVGVEAYTAAMERLGVLRQKHGFKVVVLATNPDAPADDFVYKACEKIGFDLVDFYPFWEKHKAENPSADYHLSKEDTHPSAQSHALIADLLLPHLIFPN